MVFYFSKVILRVESNESARMWTFFFFFFFFSKKDLKFLITLWPSYYILSRYIKYLLHTKNAMYLGTLPYYIVPGTLLLYEYVLLVYTKLPRYYYIYSSTTMSNIYFVTNPGLAFFHSKPNRGDSLQLFRAFHVRPSARTSTPGHGDDARRLFRIRRDVTRQRPSARSFRVLVR